MRARWRENVRIFLCRALLSPFAGVTFDDWVRLLRRNEFQVDPAYWPRAVFLSVFSMINSYFRAWENEEYGEEVRKIAVPPPVFILGHWRSGTTHLHNLLALDSRFAYPTNYEAAYPHTFLTTESSQSWLPSFALPSQRLQDNVALSVDSPQEDEFALSLMTCLSPCMGWVFPRRREDYERYLTFRTASEAEIRRWKEAFVWLLQKLTWKYRRPMLLKSPPHTARIRLLLELFPEARFIHIHRDPYVVFQSTRHLAATSHPFFRLQQPPEGDGDGDEAIIRCYQAMYRAFFEERDLIPQGRFAEIGFEDLEADPLGQVGQIYQQLEWDGFDALIPRLRTYLASVNGYRKNKHAELPPELKERIVRAWLPCFEEWGYSTRLAHEGVGSRSVVTVQDNGPPQSLQPALSLPS